MCANRKSRLKCSEHLWRTGMVNRLLASRFRRFRLRIVLRVWSLHTWGNCSWWRRKRSEWWAWITNKSTSQHSMVCNRIAMAFRATIYQEKPDTVQSLLVLYYAQWANARSNSQFDWLRLQILLQPDVTHQCRNEQFRRARNQEYSWIDKRIRSGITLVRRNRQLGDGTSNSTSHCRAWTS